MWKALDYADIARFANASGAHAATLDAVRVGLALEPDNPMLYVYRACAYDEFGRSAEAIEDCETALRLDPHGPAGVFALITLALVRERIGDPAGALDAARTAIALDPAGREPHALLGTLLAWHGDYLAAWPELECHWIDERIAFRRRFPDLVEWDGEDIGGKRLLLVHDQGLGDLLQMLRYVPRLRERGADVLLEVPAAMRALVAGTPGVSEVFLTGMTPRERFDVFARMMTLARLCDEDGRPGRSTVPYVSADDRRIRAWAPRLGPRDGRVRAGLVWAGSAAHQNDRRRSMPVETLAPLAAIEGIAWYSLQSGPRASDALPDVFAMTRLDDASSDLADTAAIVAQLDLVITVDTSVAHLAGAMGTPVWVLLPWRPDWRWAPAAETTPWYPTMRLFHALDPSWNAALSAVLAELTAWAHTRSGHAGGSGEQGENEPDEAAP